MKSVKKLITITIVILLSKLTWGTPLYTVMHKMDDAGINIVCRDGNIVIESSTKGEEIYIEYVKGNTSYYYLDNKKEWQSRRISEIRKTEENTTQEKFFKITKTENVPVNLINKTTQMKLPYSSDIGQDLTKGFMIVNHRNITVYIQPEFDFYNYDKNKMGTGANVKERQKKVINTLKEEIASTDSEVKATAETARKQLNTILAESIINSSIQAENICELVSQKETGKTNRKYKVYAPGNLEVNANEYLRNYIKEGPYKANAPVFSSELYTNKNETLENYRSVGKDENGENNQEEVLLVAAAKRYLNWAVEYAFNTQNIKNKKKIYDTVDNIWEKNSGLQTNNYYSGNFPVESDSEDNPIPYVKGGFDTPRTFWWKMHLQHNSNQFMSAVNYLFDTYWYDSSSYLPGAGIEKDINGLFKLKYAGCDSMGMLCGIIEMSGLNQFVPNIEEKNPATELDNYTRFLASYIKESPEDNSFDTEKYKSIRYTIPDLEKITTVVPSYDEIQLGDLLIKIGAKETDIAVVIDIGNKTKESIQVVYMKREKYGTAKKDFWANLDFSDSYTVRRLLVKKENAAVPAEKYKDAGWDILGKQIDLDRCSIRIGTKMEQGQNQQNDKNWRFIPNTGEYLILGNLTVDLVNSAGVQLNEIYDKEYTVKQLYVKDRSFNDAEGRDANNNNNILTDRGNIYVNRADKIEMAYFEEGKTKVFGKSIFKITREKNENDITEYYKSQSFDENDIQIRIDSRGKIIDIVEDKINSMPLSIGIRPESAEHAYPGDDYILGLEVSDGNNSYMVECDQKDYVAVYDKKMLWRANLYIDKQEKELGNLDWNDAHPWNVPAEGTDGGPAWWDDYGSQTAAKRWGYNEWNKKADGTSGDGKQVVTIPSTTWCYGYDNKSQHVITKAVAYDHQGWDSPFSFNEKVESQKKLLSQWYTSDGKKRFEKPVYQWPESCTDLGAYKENLGEELCGSETDLDNLKTLYNDYKNNSSSRWSGELDSLDYKKYIFSKNYGDKTKEPYKDYKGFTASFISNVTKNAGNVTGGNEDAVSIDGKIYYPYVPGLSDSLMTTLTKYPTPEMGKITAGVDCTGFVMSSAGYKGEHYKAMPEANIPSPVYWETTNIPTPIQTAWHSEGNAVKVGDWNTKKDIDYKKDNGELDSKSVYSYFTHLVPGDIVWYEGHIMMVSSITEPDGYDTAGKPYWNDGSGVKVLESVYTYGNTEGKGELFGCGKTRELDCILKKTRYWEIWRQK